MAAWFLLTASVMAASATGVCAGEADADRAKEKKLTILATSDLHGKFYPWDYALNEESLSGSMAQLATAVTEADIPEARHPAA